MIDQVVAEHGRLDILVNNAGINTLAHRVTLDEFPRDEWDRILAVDLTGLYEVSKAAARVMRARGSGRIINIASIAGLVPLRLQCAFVAAKAGVVNLTRAMALELGPYGILVNGIAPGSTSPRARAGCSTAEDGSFHAHAQRMLDHVPLGRPGATRRNRRGRAVPGGPRKQLHERPHSHRRRRLDRRLYPRFLIMRENVRFPMATDEELKRALESIQEAFEIDEARRGIRPEPRRRQEIRHHRNHAAHRPSARNLGRARQAESSNAIWATHMPGGRRLSASLARS